MLFWPNQGQRQAQQNLRQALSRLRRAIGDSVDGEPCILTDGRDIRFNPDSNYHLDVEVFQRLVDKVHRHAHRRLEACATCIGDLEHAIALYRGDFMEGVSVAGCSREWDEWLVLEREQLAVRAASAMHAVANARLARGDAAGAREVARVLISMEPWNEAAHRLMLRTIAVTEGRSAALQFSAVFRDQLEAELDVSPEGATEALVERVRSGSLTEPPFRDPSAHIPVPPTPIVGREETIERIERLLGGRDERLVTVHGPGGIGKTRVALEVADRQAPLWSDGVWFVPLGDVQGQDEFVGAVADALALHSPRGDLDIAAVVTHLRGREALLVLDGFDYLVDAAPLVGELLRGAPGVNLLVTSRCRLGLREEWVVQLGGLQVPGEDWGVEGAAGTDRVEELGNHAADEVGAAADESASVDGPRMLEATESVRLFAQSARHYVGDFETSADNFAAVSRICRLVDGLPLGLELAAAWVRLMPCDQIADEIESSLSFLDASMDRGLGPQRSLRSAFEYSYRMLEPDARRVFRELSVFRGGFTPDAAREIAGAAAPLLATIADNSLIRAYRSGRLDFHAALREFASEKLAAHPNELAATRDRHAAFYLGLVREAYAAARSDERRGADELIGREVENVRSAFKRALESGELLALESVVQALEAYHAGNGRWREARRFFARAADAIDTSESFAPDGHGPVGDEMEDDELGSSDAASSASGDTQLRLRVKARLLAAAAYFTMRRGLNDEVSRIADEIIVLAAEARDDLCQARGYFYRAESQWRAGDLESAAASLERSLLLLRAGVNESDGPSQAPSDATQSESEQFVSVAASPSAPRGDSERYEIERWSLNLLAGIRRSQGDVQSTEVLLEQMRGLAVAHGNRAHEAVALGNLALVADDRGDYSLAKSRYERSLAIHEEVSGAYCTGYINLAELFIEVGQYEDAQEQFDHALRLARATGAGRDESVVLCGLALLQRILGEHARAERISKEALAIAVGLGDKHAQAMALLQLGGALAALGELGAAGQAYEGSIRLFRASSQDVQAVAATVGLALVRSHEGDTRAAIELAETVVQRFLEQDLDGIVCRSDVQLQCFQVLEAAGDPRADDVLEGFRRDVLQRAALIVDADMRESFLRRVAAHREILGADL
jgi:predicted ATPase